MKQDHKNHNNFHKTVQNNMMIMTALTGYSNLMMRQRQNYSDKQHPFFHEKWKLTRL